METKRWITENASDLPTATVNGLLALASSMEGADSAIDSPIREVFALLGDKWTKLILLILYTGTFRHAVLKRTLEAFANEGDDGISQRILTLKLRSLERDGLIIRNISTDVPPKVDYALTDVGRELTERVDNLINWIGTQANYINRARQLYESNKST
jgi:DNA-binding HxlR family transcriptional regulator